MRYLRYVGMYLCVVVAGSVAMSVTHDEMLKMQKFGQIA